MTKPLFEPIAVVGRACLLPGASTPQQLWQLVLEGRDVVRAAPEGRWGVDRAHILAAAGSSARDRTWSDRGGYVEGFEALFDAKGFALPAKEVLALDPLFQWLLHTAREALRDAGRDGGVTANHGRVGAVFGNLSFPSASMSRYAEAIWSGAGASTASTPHPRNRFSSGLPALLLEKALGLEAGAFALDAACASSLYAIKSACDWLCDGRADLVLAGAVNCADDLFIHVGFSALGAMSPSGRSRPFHAEADGLVPAEGAAFVALKRLADAERDGDTIHAVLRGVGLSNDGRGKGFLVPSEEGQTRALRAAYEAANLSPSDISLLECHATGTTIGDATEIRSLCNVFPASAGSIPVGSLKSNMGHLITAAGAAALIKVIEAMRAGVRPPTLHVETPTADLSGTPLRLLAAAEPWEAADGVPRRAGISAFGFGGNNAHLVVEEYTAGRRDVSTAKSPASRVPVATQGATAGVGPEPLAIVAIGVVAAGCNGREQFTDSLRNGESRLQRRADGGLEGRASELVLDVAALGVPPKDLRETLAQQLLMLTAAREAVAELETAFVSVGDAGSRLAGGLNEGAAERRGMLVRERSGVFVGMGVDAEVARYGMRWRSGHGNSDVDRRANRGTGPLGARQAEGETDRDGIVGALTSAGVIGTMPNMGANRLNRLFDLGGASCTVSAEERSGLVALEMAARALRAGELDAAIVGAVDLSCEPVHEAAANACLAPGRRIPGDAAVALVVRRLADAERDGNRIYAVLDDDGSASPGADTSPRRRDDSTSAPDDDALPCWGPDEADRSLTPLFGHAHAASGLLHLAAAALSLHHRFLPGGRPWLSAEPRRTGVRVAAMEGPCTSSWNLREHDGGPIAVPCVAASNPLHVYDGADAREVLANLDAGRESDWTRIKRQPNAARLVLVAGDETVLAQRTLRARAHLLQQAPAGEGVHFRRTAVGGTVGGNTVAGNTVAGNTVAFVFTSAGSAYHGMGLDLLTRFPELGDRLQARFAGFPDAMAWVYGDANTPPTPTEMLWGSSCLSQLHSELTLGVLGLRPAAAIGYSSGETNSLFALGAWTDMDAMRGEIEESGLFTREVGGEFRAVARAWGEANKAVDWNVWNVLAPVDEVRRAVAREPRVHLAIVHTAGDCVIAGDADACRRVAASFGPGRALALDYNVAAHVPELDEFREQWDSIHSRAVTPVPGVRFYSGGSASAYQPSTAACAANILAQARATLDFPAVVERAWNDGVRVFIEHGPQGACSGWIRGILDNRREDAVVVALDQRGRGVEAIVEAVAALVAASVEFDPERFLARVTAPAATPAEPRTALRLPSHPDPVRLATVRGAAPRLANQPWEFVLNPTPDPSVVQTMEPAPRLAPITEAGAASRRIEHVPPVAAALSVQPTRAASSTGRVEATASVQARRIVTPSPIAPATPMPVATRDDVEALAASGVGASVPAASMDDASAGDAAALWAMQFERLAGVHQQFVEAQASAHEQFLALRSRIHHDALAMTAYDEVLEIGSHDGPAVPALFLFDDDVAQAAEAPLARNNESVGARADGVAAPAPLRVDSAATGNGHALVAPALVSSAATVAALPGFALDRQQLEVHASGRISEIFGERFAQQDGFARQVRMPMGPLLLADRMTGIDAAAGSMGKGRLWTETDVRQDSWYLHDGRMPAGIMIESGQADLMLISYLGADFLNRGERVYRLLGCQLTYHGDLPAPGDTLCYEIHVDGHASHDGVRLFFFHYDCRVNGELRLEVRGGQAGFFTDAELAASAGVLWDPRDEDPAYPSTSTRTSHGQPVRGTPRVDPPAVECTRTSFGADELRAFAEARPWECFGAGFELTHTHTRTPSIAGGRMLALGEVSEFDPVGGPWKRGYLRAETDIHPDDWFFDGHFQNDPCMPGTLMFEGCLQAMSVYLTAMGFTLIRDGWRFQPVAGEAIDLGCRGQVTPASKHLVYEVFVDEVIAGPVPTLYADLLCTVDGKKAFHARRAGLQLVPDWPLSSRPELLLSAGNGFPGARPPARVATKSGDVVFDYATLLACAWGKPSDAFGEMYARFNGTNRIPRLPGPPYHFLTRVVELCGEIGVLKAGAVASFEYDVPRDAWYFDENSCPSMPFCVLLEAALQPCGWLASYVGSALTQEGELFFRNLDGSGTQLREILPDSGILATHVTLTSISKFSGMIILGFDVVCSVGGETVYTMKTVFGFFPGEALANQVGLATEDDQRAELTDESSFRVDLTTRPARYCGGALALPEPMLLMLDRVTRLDADGGSHGLGLLRGEKDVEASEWFFKAHFFQDPVQPGSLGIEALIQLVQFYMIERGMDEGIANPRFEPLALDRTITWKYRGQVIPTNHVISSTAHIVEVGCDDRGPFAIANASLWVDGRRIYEATNVGVRIVPGEPPVGKGARVLDPAVDTWLGDHRPTWNRPALPMMSILDLMAAAVAERAAPAHVVGVHDVQVRRWLDFDGPRTVRTVVEQRSPDTWQVTLLAAGNRGLVRISPGHSYDAAESSAGNLYLSPISPISEPRPPRTEDIELEIAVATITTGTYAAAPPALERIHGEPIASPYDTAALFHGDAFHLLVEAVVGSDGASSVLDAGAGSVPRGLLHPALLDAALHAIPHDRLHLWSPKISTDEVAYPARVSELLVFGPTPTQGRIRCEVRFDGFLAAPSLPRFRIQLIGEHGVWAEMTLVESCFPKGPLGSAEPLARRSFLRDRTFVDSLHLSRVEDGATRLSRDDVTASDWMPGTIEGVYGTDDVEAVAVKEHLAARERLHPRILPDALPLNPLRIDVTCDGDDVVVRDASPAAPLDLGVIHEFWGNLVGGPADWIGRDLWDGLMQRFVRRVVVTDPDAFAALRGRSAIFVANHQVQIESLLITNLLSALAAKPVVTMANAKHEARWIGWILGRLFTYPGCRDPKSIVYFNPNAPESMADILAGIKPGLASGERSFFVHCDGTRARSCRTPVQRMSSLFLDMAVELDVPVVPVRFVGGLPVEPIDGKAEFPVGMGQQDYFVGAPVSARELRELPYRDRARRVIAAINDLGVGNDVERPLPGDDAFLESVRRWSEKTGAAPVEATFYRVLETLAAPGAETRALVEGAARGELVVKDTEVGRWLAPLARALYGPRGPAVRIER